MRIKIVNSIAILAVVTLAAYVLLGSKSARDAIPDAWGILRVACLLIDIVTVPTLAVMLALWGSEFDQARRSFRVAVVICVVNGSLLLVFFILLLGFLGS